MAFQLRLYPDRALAVVNWQGTVTGEEIEQAMQDLFEDDRWQPGFRHVWDGRGIHVLSLGLSDLRSVAQALRRLHPRMGDGRAASILPEDSHWAVGRLLVLYSRLTLPHVLVCRSAREAAEWLEIDTATLAPVQA